MSDLSGTYVVQDRNNQEELKRLIVQERLVTDAMGGVLPEQPDPTRFRRVLDIGCGPGGWLIDTAQAYPQIEKLYGIDISPTMIRHAQARAEEQNLPKERIEFLVMDALRMLEFPDDFFDLVNLRFGVSFMRQWDWPKMFSEMNRVARTGAIVRIVDGTISPLSSSKALSHFFALVQKAMYRSGNIFKESPTGLIDELPALFIRHGFNKLEVQRQVLEYLSGTEARDTCVNDILYLFHTVRPYLRRYGCEPKDYDEICRQATQDMRQPDFGMTWPFITVWAVNPRERIEISYDPSTID